MAASIKAQAARMVAELPREPLREILLMCSCDRCIDPPAYGQLIRVPPPDVTPDLIGQYFGGAGAVHAGQSEQEQYEARVIFTHVLWHLVEAVTAPDRTEERAYARRHSFVEPEHWTYSLLRTDFHTAMPEPAATQMRALLVDVVWYAIANGSPRLQDTLIYLAMVADALPEVLEDLRKGPPRRYLRFWTTIAGGSVSSHPDMTRQARFDIHLFFNAMPVEGRMQLLAAMSDPDVEAMISRYAFAAREEGWLLYLSRLLDWRDRSILVTEQSEYRDKVLR